MSEPRTTVNEPATERYCPRCGHIDHDDRRDPRCDEMTGATSEVMPEPVYCGCTDVDRLYVRALAAERASGGLDVEALRQALATVYHWALPEDEEDDAEGVLRVEQIAAEYARLMGGQDR